jgi:hypothetical protein
VPTSGPALDSFPIVLLPLLRPTTMRSRMLPGSVLLVLLAVAPAAGQVMRGPPGVADYERYARPPLGGGVFVGLLNAGAPGGANPAYVTVQLGASQGADSLCVSLASFDAAYDARFRFPRPRAAGRYQLSLPTRYARVLMGFGTARLAPLAYTAARCSTEDGVYLPAQWGVAPPPGRLRMLLNPGRVRGVEVVHAADERRFACDRIQIGGGGGIAYTYECSLDVAADHGETTFIIQRRSLGQPLPPLPVQVWLPM